MKAMMLTGIRKMEMREVPAPRIANDKDVLLRLAVVGVCGSDIHYYTTGRIGSQVVQYPFTVGHECAAVVEQVGTAVKRVKPGDRVAVDPAVSCWKCDQCLSGRTHTCRNLRFLGCPGQGDGCLSEFIVMPEECCHPLPEGMTMEQAALSEPLSISFYSVNKSVEMAGAKIGVLGCGPIGLGVLVCAKAMGCGTVYATDKIDARLDVAMKAGACWTGNPDAVDLVSAVSEKEPLLLDAVFECCGQQDALDDAVAMLKPGGKLVLIGIPEIDRVSFVIDQMRRKELCVQNIRRQCECVEPTLAMMAKGRIIGDFMVTHRFPFEETKKAFDLVAAYGEGVVKAMIRVTP